ncbi:MAG: RraA family protein [Actinomycetota bacterium]
MRSRPDHLATAFGELGVATISESGGRPMRARIRAAWVGARVAGPAYTVSCTTGDNLAVHAAVAVAPEYGVLVVDVGREHELGYWGEVLTTAAQARGLAGLVIDGCVRDLDALERLGFPVFSTGIALAGASKKLPGEIGGRARVGGADVVTGDWIVGDADGVAVIPADLVETVLDMARARAAKEAQLFAELRAGRTTIELLGLDPSPVKRVD